MTEVLATKASHQGDQALAGIPRHLLPETISNQVH